MISELKICESWVGFLKIVAVTAMRFSCIYFFMFGNFNILFTYQQSQNYKVTWYCTFGGEKSVILVSRISFFLGLIGGTKGSEGNVFINGKPVCDDYWDLNDAKVACRQLGFENAVRATQSKDTNF